MKECVFGVFPCLAALRSNRRTVQRLMLKEPVARILNQDKPSKLKDIVSLAKEKQIQIDVKSREYLDRIVGSRPHQNVIMKASPLSFERIDGINLFSDKRNIHDTAQLWLALDQIQDPMNFGAILRSAGYFGIDGIIASKKNSCRLSPVVSKASAGTMEWLKIYGAEDLSAYLKKLANSGWDVIGSTMPDEAACSKSPLYNGNDIEVEKKSILVLGNEGLGIREEVLRSCTKFITVPSYSHSSAQDLDSLNVSVASGILLHSLVSRREQLSKNNFDAAAS